MSLSQNYPTTRPTLTLDFAKAKRVDPRVTFTRASTATYFDASGTLRSAADNAPRIDFDPATLACRGLLVEEQRANLLLQSEDFATTWSSISGGAGVSPVVTTDVAVAPNATNTADEVIFDAGGTTSSDFSYISQSYSSVSGTSYAISIWAKTTSGTAAIFVDCESQNSNVVTVTTSWQRFTFVRLSATTTTRTARIGVRGGTGTDQSATVLLWGAQLEAGAFPTSYIPPTTTSLTRSADVASVTTLSPWYNQAQGTFFFAFNTAATTSGANLWETQQTSTSAERIEIGVSSAGVFNPRVVSGGAATVSLTVSTYSFGTTGKIAFAIQPTNYAASFNSATPITSSDADAPATQEILYLGCRNGNSVFLNGYIQRIAYYNTRLPNAQLQALTAP